MAERRRSPRLDQRIGVRFGERDLTYTGFTKNICPEGAFVSTSNPPAEGTRIHLQLLLPANRAIYFEAMVRRRAIASPSPAAKLDARQSGFGLEFVLPKDLMLEIAPDYQRPLDGQSPKPAAQSSALPKRPSKPASAGAIQYGASSSPVIERAKSGPIMKQSPASVSAGAKTARNVGPEIVLPSTIRPSSPPSIPASAAGQSLPGHEDINLTHRSFEIRRAELFCFEMRFPSSLHLKKAWEKEIRYGGLFLRTEKPLARGTEIILKLHLVFANKLFEARGKVVKTIENSSKGLVIAFNDLEAIKREIGYYLAPRP